MSDELNARIAVLEQQLGEANETLDAIRNGEVDAVVVGGPAGQIVYTLENADRPYRVLVEQMKEGGACQYLNWVEGSVHAVLTACSTGPEGTALDVAQLQAVAVQIDSRI